MAKPKRPMTFGCLMCGKVFKVGDEPVCGGSYNGEKLCTQRSLERDLEKLKEKEAGND